MRKPLFIVVASVLLLATACLIASGQPCVGAADCTFTCASGSCDQSCSDSSDCNDSCPGGGCDQVCNDQANCAYSCQGGGCHQQCLGHASCAMDCQGGGCVQECSTSSTCARSCTGGACTTTNATTDSGTSNPDAGSAGTPATISVTIAASCPGFSACGGNLSGTWDYASGCIDNPFPELKAACPGITTASVTASASGRLILTGSAVARQISVTAAGAATVPAQCAIAGCGAIASALGSRYSGSTCVVAGSGCSCDLHRTVTDSDTQSYTTSGGRFSAGGSSYDYCVVGGTQVTYQDVTADSPEPGVWQLIRR